MSILDKLRKNSTIKESDILENSKFFNQKDVIQTEVPAMNVALSGDLDGGLLPGLTMIAGPSKHFKSNFGLLMVKAYMDKYPDSVLLFYDSEFGTPKSYFKAFEIDMNRVLHTPITNIEQLKFDIMQQLENAEGIKRGDKVIIFVDSIGNLASIKEVTDALTDNTAQDMTRAKSLKSLFRMVTPHLNMKDIPMIAINHIYMEQKMYGKAIVSGGTGIYLSADTIFIIGRQQDKDGTEIMGYNFVINVEKSRYVREKSKISISVSHGGGINKWSGLLDMALASGVVIKPKNARFALASNPEKIYKEEDTENETFWNPLLKNQQFKDYVTTTYKVTQGAMLKDNDTIFQLDDE